MDFIHDDFLLHRRPLELFTMTTPNKKLSSTIIRICPYRKSRQIVSSKSF